MIPPRYQYLLALATGVSAATPEASAGILPYLASLIPWAGYCITLTSLRVVWQISEPRPVGRWWHGSMLALGLGLGFVAAGMSDEIFPNRHGFQIAIVGVVALFPDRVILLVMNVFDELEIDPFGIVRKIRRGGPK